MGLPFPDELIGLTFNHLDVPSLLRCMQVSLIHFSDALRLFIDETRSASCSIPSSQEAPIWSTRSSCSRLTWRITNSHTWTPSADRILYGNTIRAGTIWNGHRSGLFPWLMVIVGSFQVACLCSRLTKTNSPSFSYPANSRAFQKRGGLSHSTSESVTSR